MQLRWKLASVAAEIAIGDTLGCKQFASVAGHLLVDALEPGNETANVVVPVPVCPDVVNNFSDGARWLVRRLSRDRRGRSEIREECSIKAEVIDDIWANRD